ncbi:hypothetical protein PANO111632_17790 [Paracoccus nototheniae]
MTQQPDTTSEGTAPADMAPADITPAGIAPKVMGPVERDPVDMEPAKTAPEASAPARSSQAALPATADRSPTAPDSFLRGFVGSAVLLLAIDLSERLLFGEGYFSGLAWHPFWIVILLAAVQHGLLVGLSIVGLATMMMDWPTRPVGVDITEHYGDIASVPAQWLVVALLIGLYRQGQLNRERAMARECDRLREVNLVLAGEIHRLDAFVARAELAAVTRAPGAGQPLGQISGPADRGDAIPDLLPPAPDAQPPAPDAPGTILALVAEGGGDREPRDAGGTDPAPGDKRLPEDRAVLTRPGRAVHG